MNDAILPPSAPLQSTYDSVSMQLFEQHFDAGQLDTLNALDDEPSPFINPVYFSSFQNDGQQSYAGLDGSNLFS